MMVHLSIQDPDWWIEGVRQGRHPVCPDEFEDSPWIMACGLVLVNNLRIQEGDTHFIAPKHPSDVSFTADKVTCPTCSLLRLSMLAEEGMV